MSRFPKLTETFVLNEMLAVERAGVRTEIFPLLRQREPIVHADALAATARARFEPLLSWPIVAANLRTLARRPAPYARAWADVLGATWGSRNFFFGAIGILPKSVWMAEQMLRLGVGHVHAHFANHPTVAAFVVHRLTGIPYSFTAHGSDLHVERRMLALKIKEAAFAATVSDVNRRMMVDACHGAHAEKVHVLHCGVDVSLFRPTPKPLAGERVQILCVASFEPVKGHRVLIEACADLVRRGTRFRCRLVGDGQLRSAIEAQIETLGLRGTVEMLGPRRRDDVAGLLAASDIAVLASTPTPSGKREGIPVALMEAMAAGLPVVATATGGIPELVEAGVSGFVVPPGDAHGLASALDTLARDAALRVRMGTAGRNAVLTGFDQEATAARLVTLFREWRAFDTPSARDAAGRTPVPVSGYSG